MRFKIQAKRILFLHYILNRDDNELILQVFNAQVDDPIKGDWILTVKDDLKLFNLNHLSMDTIKLMKKKRFKKVVREACKNAAFKYLINEKEDKCKSKMTKLKHILCN